MITSATEARFKIVLPSTNRALAQALAQASPEQLAGISEGKDLRSILNGVLHEKLGASRSDQTLLELLKNTPALKTLGNPAEDLKNLSEGLKSTPSLAAKGVKLETFLANLQTLDSSLLKKSLSSSGVFMESKIASVAMLLPDLKNHLEALSSLLSSSRRNDAAALRDLAIAVQTAPGLSAQTQTPKNVGEAFEGLKQLQTRLQSFVAQSDIIHSPGMVRMIETLDALSERSAPASEVKTALGELYRALLSSKSDAVSTLLDAIEALLKNTSSLSEPAVSLTDLAEKIRTAAGSGDAPALEMGRTLGHLLASIEDADGLLVGKLLEDAMGDDLKFQLLELSDALSQLPETESAPLREPIEKLLVQIDYHQLLSCVSASTSLYLPFEWDLLEKGSIAFRKNRPDKFYCEINLTLKEYGSLDLLMGLYDNNQLELQVHPQSHELKSLIEENLPTLRSALIDAGITPRRLRIVGVNEAHPPSAYESAPILGDGGFEVTV